MRNILLLSIIFLSGCVPGITQQQTIIDWVDFLHIQDEKYERNYLLEVADEQFIGNEIGEVTFKMADHVHNTNYQSKNGDAAYLEKGTKLYSVDGMPHLVAVKSPEAINGYVFYTNEPVNREAILDQAIMKVGIYKEPTYNRFILVKSLTEGKQIQAFLDILRAGEPGESDGYDDTNPDFKSYAVVLYTDDPVAYRHSIFFDGEKYSWIPWDSEILADKIASYFK